MSDEIELIESPLNQAYKSQGLKIEIQIYRSQDSDWTLEIVDQYGNSTVWDDEFTSDQDAFDEAMNCIRTEGIEAFVGEPPKG